MDIVEQLREIAPKAFEGTPVKFAYLFGSFARGDQFPDSDVDIAIYVEEIIDKHERFKLSLGLPYSFERSLKREVDMVVLNDASFPLRGRVIRDGIVIYSIDEEQRLPYESLTFREFCDYSSFVEPLVRQYFHDVATGAR